VYDQAGFQSIRGNIYFFNPDKTLNMHTGIREISGKTYYFNDDYTRFEKADLQPNLMEKPIILIAIKQFTIGRDFKL
jgi:YHS domain-containing protein